MDLREALLALGVTDQTLSQEEKDKLDRDGYLPLSNILSADQIAHITKRTDELIAIEGESAGKEVHQEAGTNRLSDLVNKDPIFEICFTHPRLLAAMNHVLRGDLKLSSLNYRAALPGSGNQGLHADWSTAAEPGNYYVCNSAWLLDDFTETNGATRLIPGSQRSGKLAKDVLADPTQTQPDEILVIAPAGTVVIFNSHTWHGGTLNRTDRPRRVLHSYFTRRDQTQQLDQKAYIRPETYERLSPPARFILDV
jgi:ectoine hydroxylase-related dioxygenase (phytanoyl-CoA dioxygenase family)